MTFHHIDQALETLMNRTTVTSEYKLDKIKALALHLDNFQDKLTTIHIAGTNGKGSTTNFLRSILQTQGYKVGSFTSPHLISHHDRFRINNQPINDEDLLNLINWSTQYWDEYHLSMFEIDVIIAVQYFLDNNVDIVIFEVGLGGELDATNILNHPIAQVITNISFDHMHILGDTLEEIAQQKAGIIKETGLVFTGETKPEILEIFKEKANREIITTAPVFHVQHYADNIIYKYHNQKIKLSTLATYQIDNSKLAYEVAHHLDKNNILTINTKNILKGIEAAHWQGRFEKMSDNPPIFIDGAHNEDGINQLVKSLQFIEKPITILFSAVKDKNYSKMISTLETITNDIIVTEFEFHRATSTEALALGHQVKQIKDYKEAIEVAIANTKGTLIITGSLYFISDVRQYLKER